jgi:GxxExxY protein
MNVDELAAIAVDCGFKVHSGLGPGLLESAYEAVLSHSLARRGLRIERQKPIPIRYEGIMLDEGFRADLLVEDVLLIELKSVERLAPIHGKQLLTYLRRLHFSRRREAHSEQPRRPCLPTDQCLASRLQLIGDGHIGSRQDAKIAKGPRPLPCTAPTDTRQMDSSWRPWRLGVRSTA